jgi:hypothetical protein
MAQGPTIVCGECSPMIDSSRFISPPSAQSLNPVSANALSRIGKVVDTDRRSKQNTQENALCGRASQPPDQRLC